MPRDSPNFMPSALPAEVFLSHSSDDRSFAELLVDVIRRHGVPVWYSQTNILGAQQWHDEIGDALNRCDWFAVILSPRSVESMWVQRELLKALALNQYENKIIPIAYEPCEHDRLSWTLSLFQMVDFTHDFDEGCAALLRIWGIGFRR